jgi:hypothetical protein
MKELLIIRNEVEVIPTGNWNTAKDYFPVIEIDQETGVITVTTHETTGRQKKASITTESCHWEISDDKSQILLTGEVDCRNWINWKCSKSQKFVYAIFLGDSGHIYVHRAPATKGWLNANPNTLKNRLRKLGIGADENVLQQGDFLLKPANGNALPDDEFKHEYMGSGHHKFELPVLRAWDGKNTQIYVKEETIIHHEAVDGIQHPDLVVPIGKYIIGTTANSLFHTNKRD